MATRPPNKLLFQEMARIEPSPMMSPLIDGTEKEFIQLLSREEKTANVNTSANREDSLAEKNVVVIIIV